MSLGVGQSWKEQGILLLKYYGHKKTRWYQQRVFLSLFLS